MKPDQTRVGALLIDTVSLLCRNGLNFSTDIKVQGLLGITIDGTDVFLVHFNETFTDNQPTASSTEAQPARIDPTSDTAAVEARQDVPDRQNQSAAKPTFRKTGFPLLTGPRHRYGTLPLSMQARRRARQMGTAMSQRMRANSKPVEVGPAKHNERSPTVAESDEKPDCSAYKSIKTESDMEQLMQNAPEEQDDVILVESEDGGPLDEGDVIPSDLDSGQVYLKTEQRSDFSGDPMYSYNDSYEQFDPSSSDLVHGIGGPGTFTGYGRSSVDVKPMNQMLAGAETWSGSQLDWNCAQNSQTIASNYGHMPAGPQHGLNHEDIEHMGSRLCQLPVMHQHTGDRRSASIAPRYGRRNIISSELSFTKHMDPRFCTLPPGSRQMSAQLVPSASKTSSSVASYAKLTHTVTKYVCNLCDATFNHHCTLLTHQVRKHGRKKNARRGRPAMYLPTAMPF